MGDATGRGAAGVGCAWTSLGELGISGAGVLEVMEAKGSPKLGAGCDCLGLLRGVWRSLYGDEPAVPNYRADWRDQRHAAGLVAAVATQGLPAAEISVISAVETSAE